MSDETYYETFLSKEGDIKKKAKEWRREQYRRQKKRLVEQRRLEKEKLKEETRKNQLESEQKSRDSALSFLQNNLVSASELTNNDSTSEKPKPEAPTKEKKSPFKLRLIKD